jgi:hypothetical protein
LNNKRKVGGIFCDLHKAFDCVNHEILLAKLEFYGVTGNFLRLIRSYPEHRYQRVEICIKSNHVKVYSEWERIKHGVPQGSVLGPLLFLGYINDLPKTANTTAIPVLFADDMSVIVTSTNNKDFYNNIMSSLEQLNNWFTMNLLSLNLDKTNFVLFKTKNSTNIELSINYGNVNVISRTDITFLGLTLDNFLNWKVHIDNLFSKLSTSTFMIRILKQTLSQDILLMTYFAYFHSIMSYGIMFWGNSSYANKIFKLQKRVIRIITGTRNRDSCRELFKSLKILTLVSLYIFSVVIFIMDNRDDYICNYDVHKRNTRQESNLQQPTVSLALYQKGMYYTTNIQILIKRFSLFKCSLDEYFNYNLS